MKVAIYYARCDAHPEAPASLNERIWPVMHRRVLACGYKLTLLTTNESLASGLSRDETVVIPKDWRGETINPLHCAFAREQVWATYLMGLDGKVLMVEPDTYLRKPVPPPRSDLVLFRRKDKPVTPTCIRICRGSARHYYAEMADRIRSMPESLKVWYGDIKAQDSILSGEHPQTVCGVTVEWRDAAFYCFPKGKQSAEAPFAWCFNGANKKKMLDL